jgi:hypothetical protein
MSTGERGGRSWYCGESFVKIDCRVQTVTTGWRHKIRSVVQILIYGDTAPEIVVNELICLLRDSHEPLNEDIIQNSESCNEWYLRMMCVYVAKRGSVVGIVTGLRGGEQVWKRRAGETVEFCFEPKEISSSGPLMAVQISKDGPQTWAISLWAWPTQSSLLWVEAHNRSPSIHLWRYSPFWALASLRRRLHSSLLAALLLHPLVPNSCSASL